MEDRLTVVCCEGNINEVKNILDNNNINITSDMLNKVLLTNAYTNGFIEIVKYLIEYGNTHNINIDIHVFGDSPFIDACRYGHIEIIKYLIEYGETHNNKINIHIRNDYAFIIACKRGYIEIVKYLIEYGEKINNQIQEYINYQFAMNYACEQGHLSIIEYLLEYLHKNNIYILIKYLFTLACQYGRINVIKYLVEYGEKNNDKMDILNTPCEPLLDILNKKSYTESLLYIKYLKLHNHISLDIRRFYKYNKNMLISKYIYNTCNIPVKYIIHNNIHNNLSYYMDIVNIDYCFNF